MDCTSDAILGISIIGFTSGWCISESDRSAMCYGQIADALQVGVDLERGR